VKHSNLKDNYNLDRYDMAYKYETAARIDVWERITQSKCYDASASRLQKSKPFSYRILILSKYSSAILRLKSHLLPGWSPCGRSFNQTAGRGSPGSTSGKENVLEKILIPSFGDDRRRRFGPGWGAGWGGGGI
jgi:hypothetical protein